jgi:hypothetical protein
MDNSPNKTIYVEVLGRKFAVLCSKKKDGYYLETVKFKNIKVFNKNFESAKEEVAFLIEAQVRLLLRSVIEIVDGKSK